MAILLAPKLFGLILTLVNSAHRRACGGGIRLTLSALFEVLFSALFAPIMMVIQSGSVFQILLGRDTGWNPQRRDDGSIPFSDIVRRHRLQTALGVVTGISAFMIATSLFAWMSPTIIGLVLAIPLSWASGQLAIGLALKRWGLLLTPEEGAPPEVATRANALQIENSRRGFDDADALMAIYEDTVLRQAHEDMLPPAGPRNHGIFDVDHVMAQAKLVEASNIDQAIVWLKPKERMALLHDRALIGLLARLDRPKPPMATA
jgi:membrane glycosyltransferase